MPTYRASLNQAVELVWIATAHLSTILRLRRRQAMAMVPLSIAFTLLLTLTSLFQIVSTNVIRGSNPGCQPFHTTFSSSDAVSRSTGTPFIADSPEGSYAVTGQGLELYLDRPQGKITRKGGVNNVVADGATVNSTFTFL